MFDFESAYQRLEELGASAWRSCLQQQTTEALEEESHGLLSEWIETVNLFHPGEASSVTVDSGHLVAGAAHQFVHGKLQDRLMRFHPWRKGPLRICGQTITTEWRSDWKWDRACEAVELRDRLVLDVGCGNGYFGYRMLEAGASMVIGLDPFHLFVMQHELLKRLIGPVANFVFPVADTVLHRKLKVFDVAFSMGVLYHRTSPIDHLHVLSGSVKRGGQVVLETLVIDDPSETVLVPDGRYAMMRNVWFLPSVSMLLKWMKRTGFENLTVVDVTATTIEEQRSTDWMTFDSLPDFLAPDDSTKTIEGYPAPLRATIHATVR